MQGGVPVQAQCREDGLRPERLDQVQGAAGRQSRQRADDQAGDPEQRQSRQQAIRLVEAGALGGRQGGRENRSVAQHYALRAPGRSRGVQHARDRIGVDDLRRGSRAPRPAPRAPSTMTSGLPAGRESARSDSI